MHPMRAYTPQTTADDASWSSHAHTASTWPDTPPALPPNLHRAFSDKSALSNTSATALTSQSRLPVSGMSEEFAVAPLFPRAYSSPSNSGSLSAAISSAFPSTLAAPATTVPHSLFVSSSMPTTPTVNHGEVAKLSPFDQPMSATPFAGMNNHSRLFGSSFVPLESAASSALLKDDASELTFHNPRLPRTVAAANAPTHSNSPGLGIRRLAEKFLDSIGDESPQLSSRALNQQCLSQSQSFGYEPLDSPVNLSAPFRSSMGFVNLSSAPASSHSSVPTSPGLSIDLMERKRREVDEMLKSISASREPLSPSLLAAPSPTRSPLSVTHAIPRDEWAQLHAEIIAFAETCQSLQHAQSALREDLSQRTRRAVKSVWPTADVDLVGSVSAGVALPKSDLDFVVFFPVAKDCDSRPPFTIAAPINEDGHASIDTNASKVNPLLSNSSDDSETSLLTDYSSSPTVNSNLSANIGLVHHFAAAGSLIKLLGGRKKSKLLFRSTKIQVFKDINLIRLRDGCSGISMDLWFPTSSFITLRSQQHTQLIQSYLTHFSFFYPLSVVIKSFMQQQMLNSGYSGLGSYGVLLMIVRFLQWQKQQARDSGCGSDSDTNLGKTLCDFFRFYVTFDYTNLAVDVRGDGCFFDKPELSAIAKKVKGQSNGQTQHDGGEDDDREGDDSGDETHISTATSTTINNDADIDPSVFTSLTLVIQDPQDVNNFIICHHRALRNMIQAFVKALTILDPDSPVPAPIAPISAIISNGGASNSSVINSLPPSSFIGRTTSDIVYPSALLSHSHSHAQTSTLTMTPAQPITGTRFQRLLDLSAAYAGPSMKECPSIPCQRLNPPTLCPIQNKVCFHCGYMFIKGNGGSGGGGIHNGGKHGNHRSGNKKALGNNYPHFNRARLPNNIHINQHLANGMMGLALNGPNNYSHQYNRKFQPNNQHRFGYSTEPSSPNFGQPHLINTSIASSMMQQQHTLQRASTAINANVHSQQQQHGGFLSPTAGNGYNGHAPLSPTATLPMPHPSLMPPFGPSSGNKMRPDLPMAKKHRNRAVSANSHQQHQHHRGQQPHRQQQQSTHPALQQQTLPFNPNAFAYNPPSPYNGRY